MLMKRDEGEELRPPQWELEESSFEELSAELTDGTITRARAIKLAGAALLSASGLMMLFQSPAEAGRRRKKRRRRRRRRSTTSRRTTRVRTNRRRVRFRDRRVGTSSPVENVTIENLGPESVFVSPDLGDDSFTLAPTFDPDTEILPGTSVTVPIVFTPLEEGVHTGELTLVDTDGDPVIVVDANNNTVDAIKLEGTALPAL